MKFKDFMSAVNRKNLKHVYLLAGAENYFIDRAREKILSLLFVDRSARSDGLTTLDCDDKIELSAIINALETAPLFTDINVVIVKNVKFFKGKTGEDKSDKGADHATERLSSVLTSMLETNYAIFTTNDAPDKRKKLYKTIDKVGAVLEAEPLRSYQLDSWLDEKLRALGLTMNVDARQYFVETVSLMPEVSLGLLDNELDKTALFATDKRITRATLEKVLASLPEVSNFALIDAVSARNVGRATEILSMQRDDLKNMLGSIALLARQVRLLLRAKHYIRQGLNGKALGEPLGLNPFIAQRTGEASKKFSETTLENALVDLSEADYGLKTGTSGSELFERAVMKLLLS